MQAFLFAQNYLFKFGDMSYRRHILLYQHKLLTLVSSAFLRS